MRGKPGRAWLCLAVAAVLLLPAPASALPIGPPAAPPLAPGPLPGGNLTNGSLPNGSLINGTLPNGSFINGTLPNGSLPNGTRLNRSGPGNSPAPTFTNATAAAGFAGADFTRLAWGDYDNDGYDDVMFNGGFLYHNNRDGTFSDVSVPAGTRGDFTGGVWGDYNNDGKLDFYATAWRGVWDTLFRNNGDGSFTNVTAAAGGVKDDLPTEAAAWADYDRDGCLDLYVVNYEWPPLDNQTNSQGTPNVLWKNDCDGTFTNATLTAGLFESRRSRGAVWGDYNNDGWADLYVSNYRLEPNELWMNNKNGTFTDVAAATGTDCDNRTVPRPNAPCGHSIGSDFADYDEDGNLDLFVANLDHPRTIPTGSDFSQLYMNRGPPSYSFIDVRQVSGILYCETASDPTWGDFDGDGYPDLFVTSIYEGAASHIYQNARLFREVSSQTGVSVTNAWGAAWSDYDRDGDLDLLVGSSEGVRLFRNDGNNNTYVELELVGRASNKAAIGARVEVSPAIVGDPNPSLFMQEVQGGDGTGVQSSMRLLFGLAGNFQTRGAPGFFENATVRIVWPSGLRQNLTLRAGGIYRVEEPEGTVDLAVTALAALPANPIVGGQVTLTATVENVGTAPPSAADVVFYRGSPTTGTEVGRKPAGKLVGSQNFSVFFSAPASPGPLTLSARVEGVTPQDQEPANDAMTVTVTVRSANEAPVARLTASPTSVQIGDTVTFDGSASTDDSSITQYIFDFADGESFLSNDSTTNHSYTEGGTYTARLTVIDDNGAPSQVPGNATVTVLKPGQRPPTAVIDSVSPASPEMLGATVVFEGHGVATDASITAYEWTSNIDGPLSDQPLFQVNTLTLGLHTVAFRVQDSNGVWSDPTTAPFKVVNTGGVQITFIGLVDGSAVSGAATVRGSALPPSGLSVTRVDWRVDLGNLQPALGGNEWSFPLNAAAFTQGPHDITVVVTDSENLKTTRTVHVVFGPPGVSPAQGNFSLYLGAGIGAVALAVAAFAGFSARRRKARRTAAAKFAKLPVVAPPPPIRPLPVPPRGGPGGPPKQRVRVVAKRQPGASPRAPPPSR